MAMANILENIKFASSSFSDINTHFVHIFIPNIAFLAVYILIGIVGNSLVIYIYLRKMEKTTDNHFFIPCLAVGDMLACTVCSTAAIVMFFYYTNFTHEVTCKIMWYSMTWSASGAALILVFIAFQRYKKICQPFKPSTLLDRKLTIVICLYVSSTFVSSPLLYTSGLSHLTLEEGNKTITLHICERIRQDLREDWRINIALAFTGLEAFIVLSVATILTTLYLKVGLKLAKHLKTMSKKRKDGSNGNSQETESSSEVSTIKPGQSKSIRKKGTYKSFRHKREKFNQEHHYTYIFIAISGVCIVTYSPRLLLMILESVKENFWLSFYENESLLRFLKLLNRFHIINNIANPFLYAMFDKKFKAQLLQILQCK
ncbi:orexin receptor type 2-like [Mytilus trossulus]|uniref:orexin receptor type 2-like n=1 Tax=Mytilus trossulus TaxID=6551 RepID=UPI0030059D11